MILVGVTLSKLVEFPMLALRDRLYPTHGKTVEAKQPTTKSADDRGLVDFPFEDDAPLAV